MTVTQLTNSVCGAELQSNVRQASTELASVQAGCGVNTLFRPSVVDLESGKHGIRWLIARILTEAQAVFPRYAGEFRNVYVAYGLTTEQICSKVRAANGFDKYPDKTIIQNLSVVMARSAQVASMRLTVRECPERKSKRPVYRWYLLQGE
jgi:hypothetical protein